MNSSFENRNPGAVLAGDRCGQCGGALSGRVGVAQVSVKLSTMIGLDDHPALIAGVGPVVADIARQIALNPLTNPQWRWSVFDPRGDLLHHGATNRRPTPTPRDSCSETRKTDPPCTCPRIQPRDRRSTIELQLTLADLAASPDTAWRDVIADIAAQVSADAKANPTGKWSEVDQHGRLRHHGHTTRHPNAEESAFIRARDRTCRAPHCRRPATTCDLDHAIEHHNRGPSHRGNCRCLCRAHHTLRHTPGVQVTDQTTDHGRVTIWTTPDGKTHTVPRDKDILLTIDEE
jgi:hypothetical protein